MDRFPEGYLALPSSKKGQPVLVLHAWWGLNNDIKAYCDRLAGAGFTAFAPDLYNGKIATTIPEAERMSAALDENFQQTRDVVLHAASFLADRSAHPENGLAVIGFSLGAYFALDLSVNDSRRITAVVVYYGTGVEEFTGSRATYLGHFAEEDPYEPSSNTDFLEEALGKASRPVTIFRYPGTGHWFAEPGRQDAYDQSAAELAWERTLEFLRQTFKESYPV